jgi:hypothetical protein
MDSVGGVKTPFANWKMVERILHKIVNNPELDESPEIIVCLVLVADALMRKFSDVYASAFMGIIYEFLRKISREVLHQFLRFLRDSFLGDLQIVFREKGLELYISEKRT